MGMSSCDDAKEKIYFLDVDEPALRRDQAEEKLTFPEIKQSQVKYYCMNESDLEALLNRCFGGNE